MRKTNNGNTKRMTALFLAVTMLMMAVGTISAEAPLVTVTITGHSGTFVY
ncbi:MAG: hypothetical protein GX749_08470, partial [Ruminococcaceae bacterium]|nr:hypothetical protein [Oscillospiraceae bacterium]